MRTLGVILARGGSKRIPRKNLRVLGSSPLIGWAIYGAAGLCDEVVLSSDDPEILRVGQREYESIALLEEIQGAPGLNVVRRADALATDDASSYPALMDAVDRTDGGFSHVMLLQPTSPLRARHDVWYCLDWARRFGPPLIVSVEQSRAVPNGAIYLARLDWLRDRLARGDAAPFDDMGMARRYGMPDWRSIDIDTEDDFARAEEIVDESVPSFV